MTIEEIAKQHKYCFICGHETVYKEKNILQCPNCKYHTYISPVPCNGVIIQDDNKEIMLVVRKTEPKMGFWDIPGGFISVNENLEESITREIEEELNAKIYDLKYYCSTSDEYTYESVTFPTLGLVFTGSVRDQKITPADDVESYKFFELSNIPFEKIAFEGVKIALRKFIENK